MSQNNSIIQQANTELQELSEEPLAFESFLELVVDNPQYVSHSSKYLYEAITAAGTRTVIEGGEELERYCFFDDPHNNGKHAVLGNTEALNKFVETVQTLAKESGKNGKILWIEGPTATGKSEFKRCLVSGLQAYAKTDAGKRFTIEWNVNTNTGVHTGISYGESPNDSEKDWYECPVNTSPLAVLPEESREAFVAQLNESVSESDIAVQTTTDLDPFSQEGYDILSDYYSRNSEGELFSKITSPEHLRVKRFIPRVGDGIGILHSEDEGKPKQRLAGSWMGSVLKNLDSRGRMNPQAFSYDGVLSQGNGLISLVEDASQHTNLLAKFLNICDERAVKLNNKIQMDLDTVFIIISNPDLEVGLNQHAQENSRDPLKALKRRMAKHEFLYLTNMDLESALIRREITNEGCDVERAADDIETPLTLEGVEIAPHTIEAAACYSVLTRLDDADVPRNMDLLHKAIIYQQGYCDVDSDTTFTKDDLVSSRKERSIDGEIGIPVTFTKDIIRSLVQENDHIIPQDIVEEMSESLSEAPLFSDEEVSIFEEVRQDVSEYILEKQATDVREAMLRDMTVSEEDLEEYVEQVQAWNSEDTGSSTTDEFSPLKMKLFEIEQLGVSIEEDYKKKSAPKKRVKDFRRERVIEEISKHAWKNRQSGFAAGKLKLTELPAFDSILSTTDWSAVKRVFPDFDPNYWREPPENTETHRVKQDTIQNMIDLFGYSEESAKKTAARVFQDIKEDKLWD